MRELENTLKVPQERPDGIAKIAYTQASFMTKCESPTKRKIVIAVKEESKSFFQLPIFETITSTFCNAYTTVKQSNQAITSILDETEKSLGKGSEIIGSAIEKIPSVNLSTNEFIENLKNNLRLTYLSTIKWCENIVTRIANAFNQLSITNEDKTEKTKTDKTKSFG